MMSSVTLYVLHDKTVPYCKDNLLCNNGIKPNLFSQQLFTKKQLLDHVIYHNSYHPCSNHSFQFLNNYDILVVEVQTDNLLDLNTIEGWRMLGKLLSAGTEQLREGYHGFWSGDRVKMQYQDLIEYHQIADKIKKEIHHISDNDYSEYSVVWNPDSLKMVGKISDIFDNNSEDHIDDLDRKISSFYS